MASTENIQRTVTRYTTK